MREYCDHCGERSAPSEIYPRCESCRDVVCYDCTSFGSDYEDEGRIWATCHECAEADQLLHEDRELEDRLFQNPVNSTIEDVTFD